MTNDLRNHAPLPAPSGSTAHMQNGHVRNMSGLPPFDMARSPPNPTSKSLFSLMIPSSIFYCVSMMWLIQSHFQIPNMFPANSSGKEPVKLAPPVLSSTQPTPPSIPLLASILQRYLPMPLSSLRCKKSD